MVTFSEATDGTTAPTIAATTSANFTVGAGAWSVGDTVYTVTLTHDGTVEEIAAETITANGAVDADGNTQTAAGTTSAFVVDTDTPSTPAAAPDLQAASDTGTNTTDDLTSDTTPTFDVVCTEVGSTINLYVDAAADTTHTCTAVATESITASALAT